MITIEALRTFFGWCSVINVGVLMISLISVILLRGPVSRIHAKMFGVDEKELSLVYFKFIAQYKMAILIFNIVPYLALLLMK